jgi:hypothetical protein
VGYRARVRAGERTRWKVRHGATWVERRVVFEAALEVLRSRLDVVAVPQRPADLPSLPGTGRPVDGVPDAVMEGRRVPGLAVVRAHGELAAVAAEHGGRLRGRRLLLDPADDRQWRVATLVGP